MANVIVACEESQAVTIELRKLGHNAFSFDLQKCSGGHPEWHIIGDVLEALNGGHFITQSGDNVYIDYWHCLIGFPPCTLISNAGARWMYPTAGNICVERLKKAKEAKDFFMQLFNAPIKLIGLENPQPLKVVGLPKATQLIQPYEFGHPYSKKTFLWLKKLPALLPTLYANNHEPYIPSNTGGAKRGQKATIKYIKKIDRSKTFQGIAMAMATQWNDTLNQSGASL